MTQAEAVARVDDFVKGAPTLSSIPIDTPPNQLRVRHAGYDVSGAELDPNVTFPYERLHELAQDGVIGEFVAEAYSFMGTCSQLRPLNREGPAWVEMLQEQDVDAALLVPV
jgi:D-proline reductase (dithiol) PrdB